MAAMMMRYRYLDFFSSLMIRVVLMIVPLNSGFNASMNPALVEVSTNNLKQRSLFSQILFNISHIAAFIAI